MHLNMHNNNGNRVDYAIIDKFEFTAVVEKYDTFITHTNNYEETSATMVTIYAVFPNMTSLSN